MARNITFSAIDETYPIAGRDNDSQGFRDNFSVIKNNFEAAKGEIEDLQLNTSRLDDANNFNGNNLVNFNVVYSTEELFDGGLRSTTTLVDWKDGPYQIFSVNTNLQFTIYNFPTIEKLAKLKLQVVGDGTPRTITFVINGAISLKKSTRVPTTITVTSATNPIIVEFWTYDAGNTVFMDYLGIFS